MKSNNYSFPGCVWLSVTHTQTRKIEVAEAESPTAETRSRFLFYLILHTNAYIVSLCSVLFIGEDDDELTQYLSQLLNTNTNTWKYFLRREKKCSSDQATRNDTQSMLAIVHQNKINCRIEVHRPTFFYSVFDFLISFLFSFVMDITSSIVCYRKNLLLPSSIFHRE